MIISTVFKTVNVVTLPGANKKIWNLPFEFRRQVQFHNSTTTCGNCGVDALDKTWRKATAYRAVHRLCVIGSPRGAAEKFDAKRVVGSVFF